MVQRQVDVIIKGNNQTTSAFRGASQNIDAFGRRVTSASTGVGRFHQQLGNVAIALSSLPGPLGRLTAALSQFAVGGALTVGILAGIAAITTAWDKMVNKTNVVTDRFKEMNKMTREAMAARLGILQGREANLAAGREASGASGYSIFRSQFQNAAHEERRRKELQETRDLIAKYGQALAEFDRAEQASAGKLADKLAARIQSQVQEDFDKKILPMLGSDTARPGILSTGIGTTGSTPAMTPLGDAAAIDTAVQKFSDLDLAIGSVVDSLSGTGKDAIVAFADTWAEATDLMIQGSLNLGQAIVRAGRKAVGGVLMAKGRETLLDAAKAAVQGFTNPAEFAKAAKLFAIGTAQISAGSLFSGGGGGGGGGGLGAGGFSEQQRETDRGEGVIYVNGGLLDMADPRQADALAAALNELGSRRVVIRGA